jgi:AcrR family transcriptional regulator
MIIRGSSAMRSEFKTKKSEATFERLLAVAGELFAAKGYHATTMRDLSKESGLGLGSIYYYFRSKEELVQAFYMRFNRKLIMEFAASRGEYKSFPDAVGLLLRLKIKRLGPHRDLLKVIMKEAIDPDSSLSPLSQESSPVLRMNLDLLEQLAEETQFGKPARRAEIAKMTWLIHLMLLTFWLHDRTAKCEATDNMVGHLQSYLKLLPVIEKVPGAGSFRQKLAADIQAAFPT